MDYRVKPDNDKEGGLIPAKLELNPPLIIPVKAGIHGMCKVLFTDHSNRISDFSII
jgi:hypothetical protein